MCASTHLEPLPTLRPPQPGPRYWQLNAGVQNFKRSFAGECKRCDEMARRLDFLLNEVIAAGLTPLPRDEEAHLAPIPDLDSNLKQTHEEMRAMKANEVEVLRSHNALREHLLVLQVGVLGRQSLVARP